MTNVAICAICEQSSLCENDHFPVAGRHGGVSIWPLCRACHDLTDRLPLDKWSPNLAWGSLASIFEKSNRNERLLLVKLFKIAVDANFAMAYQTKTSVKPARPSVAPPTLDYKSRVLECVEANGPLTRSQIAKRIKASRQGVLGAISELVDSGQLVGVDGHSGQGFALCRNTRLRSAA